MTSSHFVLRRRVCPAINVVRNLHWISSRTVSSLSKYEKSNVVWKEDNQSNPNSLRTHLPEAPCRTRFAPSPTGYLHLGSLRTALYNYLLAKATNGQFVLRLEDTDQSRLVADAEQRLYEDLKWAGLTWDEGPDVGGQYGPYRQSERLGLYDKHSDRLIQEGKAYRCFCPPDELAAHKLAHRDHHSAPPPNPCIHLSSEESAERAYKGDTHAVIFKSAPEPTEIQDIVYGSFKRRLPEDDFILRKRDGFPTYHFANVVDDHAMKITHVVRGAEWLVSTPKHVELYKALQWTPPAFAHVGLLVDPKRQKLSKRALGADLSSYKEEHILPSALLNFVALLGWNPGLSQDEVLTLQDMAEKFRLRFTKGDIMVQMPGKLPYFDFAHRRRLFEEDPPNMPLLQEYVFNQLEKSIAKHRSQQISAYAQKSGKTHEGGPQLVPVAAAAYSVETGKIIQPEFFLKLLRMLSTKNDGTMSMVPYHARHLIWEIPEPFLIERMHKSISSFVQVTGDPGLEKTALIDTAERYALAAQALENAYHDLEKVGRKSWRSENLSPPAAVEEAAGSKLHARLAQLLRWALVASDPAPPNKEVMEFLGRDETLKRIKTAASVARRAAQEPDWQPEGFDWVPLVREPPHTEGLGSGRSESAPEGKKQRKKPGEGRKALKKAGEAEAEAKKAE